MASGWADGRPGTTPCPPNNKHREMGGGEGEWEGGRSVRDSANGRGTSPTKTKPMREERTARYNTRSAARWERGLGQGLPSGCTLVPTIGQRAARFAKQYDQTSTAATSPANPREIKKNRKSVDILDPNIGVRCVC